MTDNENVAQNVQEQKVDTMDVDYLEAIKQIKSNSVDKSAYESLKAENKKLLDSIVNGQTMTTETKEEEVHPDVKELRNKLFNHYEELNNLEYWKNTLALREELIRQGEKDPFLPYGEHITPTYEDTQAAERVADVVQQCIDYADGDSQVFTNELQRRTNDVRYKR